MSKHSLTPEKAKKILHDKEVRGRKREKRNKPPSKRNDEGSIDKIMEEMGFPHKQTVENIRKRLAKNRHKYLNHIALLGIQQNRNNRV